MRAVSSPSLTFPLVLSDSVVPKSIDVRLLLVLKTLALFLVTNGVLWESELLLAFGDSQAELTFSRDLVGLCGVGLGVTSSGDFGEVGVGDVLSVAPTEGLVSWVLLGVGVWLVDGVWLSMVEAQVCAWYSPPSPPNSAGSSLGGTWA